MAKNVKINGVLYPDVPEVSIPLAEGQGNATFRDTGDATAVSGDIVSGKTAYIGSGKVSGTMANNGAVSGTISKAGDSYTIPSGYHIGSGTVKISAAEQAKLVSANIKGGQTILGGAGKTSVVDTSDATAGAGTIVSGKTAYVNGAKVTGTATIGTADTRKAITVIQTPNQTIEVTGVPVKLSQTTGSDGNVVYKTEYHRQITLTITADSGYTAGNIIVDGADIGQGATINIKAGMLITATDATKMADTATFSTVRLDCPLGFNRSSYLEFRVGSQRPETPKVTKVIATKSNLRLVVDQAYADCVVTIVCGPTQIDDVSMVYADDADFGAVMRADVSNSILYDYFQECIDFGDQMTIIFKVTG